MHYIVCKRLPIIELHRISLPVVPSSTSVIRIHVTLLLFLSVRLLASASGARFFS